MNITASIQARMGSSRLPGKVLKSINDKPMLLWQIDRIKRSRLIDNIIVATSNSELDNEIVEFCIENEIQYFSCLLYTSPSPRDSASSRMPSSA